MNSKELNNALEHIHDVLSDYCENNIESDKKAQKALNKSWNIITRATHLYKKAE